MGPPLQEGDGNTKFFQGITYRGVAPTIFQSKLMIRVEIENGEDSIDHILIIKRLYARENFDQHGLQYLTWSSWKRSRGRRLRL